MKLELPDTIDQATFYCKDDLPFLPDVVYSGGEAFACSSWETLKTT